MYTTLTIHKPAIPNLIYGLYKGAGGIDLAVDRYGMEVRGSAGQHPTSDEWEVNISTTITRELRARATGYLPFRMIVDISPSQNMTMNIRMQSDAVYTGIDSEESDRISENVRNAIRERKNMPRQKPKAKTKKLRLARVLPQYEIDQDESDSIKLVGKLAVIEKDGVMANDGSGTVWYYTINSYSFKDVWLKFFSNTFENIEAIREVFPDEKNLL